MDAIARDELDTTTRAGGLAPVLLPPLFLLAIAVVLQWSGVDEAVARGFYDPVSGRWALDPHQPLSRLLYHGERYLVFAAVLAILGVVVAGIGEPDERSLRRPLLYVLACLLATVGLVSLGKHTTNVDCPRALAEFGGSRPHVGLFEDRPDSLPRALCFPAGHSSSAFSFVSLFFLPVAMSARWRRRGLAVALGAGLAFAATQWARGMHFPSHDVVSAAVAWAVALATNAALYRAPAAA